MDSIAYNGFGLGEVAEPEAQLKNKTLKLKTNVDRRTKQPFCQTRVMCSAYWNGD